MPSTDLKFRLLGEDAGASRALSKVQKEASGAHDAFDALGSQLSNLGGPFGVAQEAFEGVASGLDHVKEHGKSVGSVLTGIGIAATGAGVLLAQFGAKDQQAQAQLRQSVTNTGHSWGDFKDRIEEAIKSQERFGHTADDTQNALNTLTTALQDPNKALQEMGLVADIAARKHISLAEAAALLIKIQGGSTKALKEFGIVLDGNGTLAEQLNRALDELQQRLSGQASSAADTFSGRLQAAKAQAEDFISSMSNLATVLTSIGPLATGAGAALSYLQKKKAENAVAAQALAPAEAEVAAAQTAVATTAVAAATAEQRLAVAETETATVSKGAMLAAAGKGLLKAGALAGGGMLLGQVGGGIIGGTGGHIFSGVATGAGIGAAVGSVVPGVGTVVGGGVGAVAGGLISAFGAGDSGPSKDQLAQLAATGPAGVARVKARRDAIAQMVKVTGQGSDQLKRYDSALKEAADSEGLAKDNATAFVKQQEKLVPVLDKDVAALHKYTDAALGTGSTMDAFQQSINDLTAATVKNKAGNEVAIRTLNGTSDAAIANRNSLRQLAQQELAHVDALKQAGASSITVRAQTLKMSEAFEAQAVKVFGNKAAVDRLLGSLHLLPKQVRTEILIDPKDRLKAEIARAKALIATIPGAVNVELGLLGHGGTKRVQFATGGIVTGGVPGRDSVPALLTPGEFVVTPDGRNLHVSGGGGNIYVTVSGVVGNADAVATAIEQALAKKQRLGKTLAFQA